MENQINSIEQAQDCFKKFCISGIYSESGYHNDDELLERFFEFIDLLEEKAKDDIQYYAILADCYYQIGDIKKAVESFKYVYNPKDKKHIKKLYNFETTRMKKVPRPSKRATNIPKFKYISKKICNEFFEVGEECNICNKTNVPIYIGEVYDSNNKRILIEELDEKFCANCLKMGLAAKKINIRFNSKYILGYENLENQAKELVYNTPAADRHVDEFCEGGWMVCCDDFCELDLSKQGLYIFKCMKCKKTYEAYLM